MTRRLGVLLSVLALAGGANTACSRSVEQPLQLPASIFPGWVLRAPNTAGLADAPSAVRAAHPTHSWRAAYDGPNKISAHVRVWELPAAVSLDLLQRWRPEPNTVVFSSDRYLAEVDWSGADKTQAGALVRSIQRAIGIPTAR